jgi:hypothetical protein
VREAFLPRRILRLQLDKVEERRQRKNSFYHTIWYFLLSSHAFWPKKYRSNLSTDDAELLRKSNRPNIQVYINDVVITTRKEESLISDLQETFDNLNRYKLKLNPTKCSFGISTGKHLGFLVSARGIEANPEKI